MSESAARAQRATALEEKRKRLEEMRARREQRGAESAASSARASATRGNLDEYIDDLLGSSGPDPTAATATATADTVQASASSDAPELVAETDTAVGAQPQTVGDANTNNNNNNNNVIAVAAPAPPVKTVETFTIATQTDPEDFPEQPDGQTDEGHGGGVNEEEEEEEEEDRQLEDGDGTKYKSTSDKANRPDDGPDPKILSPEELEAEIRSKPFSEFLNTASKKVERVLGTAQLANLLVDYVGEMDGVKRNEKVSDGSVFLASRQVFECPKWTAHRDVTDLHWSPLHRELMLSTYDMPMSMNTSGQLSKGSAAVSAVSPNDTSSASLTPRSGDLQSDGLALIWSLAMPGRPEHIFTCGSPVLTGRFHPTETPLVIGGCQSGQLVVWDIRAGRLPVQRSSLTSFSSSGSGDGNNNKGHSHPICSMEFIEGGVRIHCRLCACLFVGNETIVCFSSPLLECSLAWSQLLRMERLISGPLLISVTLQNLCKLVVIVPPAVPLPRKVNRYCLVMEMEACMPFNQLRLPRKDSDRLVGRYENSMSRIWIPVLLLPKPVPLVEESMMAKRRLCRAILV